MELLMQPGPEGWSLLAALRLSLRSAGSPFCSYKRPDLDLVSLIFWWSLGNRAWAEARCLMGSIEYPPAAGHYQYLAMITFLASQAP